MPSWLAQQKPIYASTNFGENLADRPSKPPTQSGPYQEGSAASPTRYWVPAAVSGTFGEVQANGPQSVIVIGDLQDPEYAGHFEGAPPQRPPYKTPPAMQRNPIPYPAITPPTDISVGEFLAVTSRKRQRESPKPKPTEKRLSFSNQPLPRGLSESTGVRKDATTPELGKKAFRSSLSSSASSLPISSSGILDQEEAEKKEKIDDALVTYMSDEENVEVELDSDKYGSKARDFVHKVSEKNRRDRLRYLSFPYFYFLRAIRMRV